MTTADQSPRPASSPQDRLLRLRQIRMMRDLSLPVRSITRRLTLPVPPGRAYAALLDAETHAAITGAPARIDPEVAGDFAVCGGALTGAITELLDGRHIVIACRLAHDRWPEKHYATATFMLNAAAEGCVLTFYQQDVPAEAHEAMARLWEEHYWSRLPAALA
jgi:activator of HSP90 ATPase